MDKNKFIFYVVFLIIAFFVSKLVMDGTISTFIDFKEITQEKNAFAFVHTLEIVVIASIIAGICTGSLLKFGETRDSNLVTWNDIAKMLCVFIVSLFTSVCYLIVLNHSALIQNQFQQF